MYKITLTRDKDVKLLYDNLTKHEADDLYKFWIDIFNEDVYNKPVPVLKVVKERE